MPVPNPSAFPDEPPPELFRVEADLRAALRTFERRSETLARQQGLTPRQFQLLLQVKGAPDGSERATTTELTRRLQLNQSSVSELVQRALQAGWLQRTMSPQDARSWWLTLTPTARAGWPRSSPPSETSGSSSPGCCTRSGRRLEARGRVSGMLLMREVNLRIHELTQHLDGKSDYFCECGSPRCRERTLVQIHAHQFADVLALEHCFLVARGHVPAGGRVLREHPDYVLVEVTGL